MQRLFILLVLLLSLPAMAATPRARIELLPHATVMAPTVLLGDVARIHANDVGLMRQLVQLPVGRAPQVGDVGVVQREALVQWIRRQSTIAPQVLEWQGASETRVLRAVRRLPGEDIAQAAVAAAQEQLSAAGRSGEMQVRPLPRDIDLPEGKVRLQVRGAEHMGTLRRLPVWVDVWAGERFVRTVAVGLDIASATLPTQEPQPNEPGRLPEMQREPLAVVRGDWARLRSSEGAITLESRVEVLQDGRPGQRIRVRQQGASTALFARVLAPGQLELAP
jgi:flagellar basal body P-ring formation protein FlgA